MMVQTAEDGRRHFVMTMAQHTDFCRQLAEAFGNDLFDPLDPRDDLVTIAAHHDDGWAEYDARPGLDPETGLPYSLTRTPVMAALKTNYLSPEINQARGALIGLLSSMHSWGLHNKRFGVSQFVVKNRSTTSITVPQEFEPAKQRMMSRELERQTALKAQLAGNPATRHLVEDKALMRCYKYLQFFDTLSLYFHLDHDAARGTETFIHVPKTESEDASVTVKRVSDGRYSFAPFPFSVDGLVVRCFGRRMEPLPAGACDEDLHRAIAQADVTSQDYTFLAA